LDAFPIALDGKVVPITPTYDGYTAWHIEHVGADGVLVSDDDGEVHHFAVPRFEPGSVPSTADGAIFAPMPGRVIALNVAEGEAVEAGQRLLVLEAMKMEHALTAPFAGTVAELAVSEGAQVQVEALLARIEPAAD
jgi:3-methylcrotonyl-CoA carboxylase alpha subunit